MKVKTFIIDAFTNEAFKGNPAGVCLPESELNEGIMQSIASELNLSETAFLVQSGMAPTKYFIRYFTPTVEIAFCGHATLASAKLLLHHLGLKNVEFTTAHSLKIEANAEGERIRMVFPLYDTLPYTPSPSFYAALGIGQAVNAVFAEKPEMLIIEVNDKATLLGLTPDFAELTNCPDQMKEVVVTCRSDDPEYDFYSRCFCPWIGINEDPVTGAAHSVLAKYWGAILNKTEMLAWQLSQRGGYMQLKITNDAELEVRSNACIVFEGEMNI